MSNGSLFSTMAGGMSATTDQRRRNVLSSMRTVRMFSVMTGFAITGTGRSRVTYPKLKTTSGMLASDTVNGIEIIAPSLRGY
jgi:hypothetical protein